MPAKALAVGTTAAPPPQSASPSVPLPLSAPVGAPQSTLPGKLLEMLEKIPPMKSLAEIFGVSPTQKSVAEIFEVLPRSPPSASSPTGSAPSTGGLVGQAEFLESLTGTASKKIPPRPHPLPPKFATTDAERAESTERRLAEMRRRSDEHWNSPEQQERRDRNDRLNWHACQVTRYGIEEARLKWWPRDNPGIACPSDEETVSNMTATAAFTA